MGRQFGAAGMAGAVLPQSEYAAAGVDPPHAEVQSDGCGDQYINGLHSDGLSIAQGRSGCAAAGRISACGSRARKATLLLEVWMPGVPHYRLQTGQRLHWANADACWFALDGSMGLWLDERSLGIAAGHARAEAQYERRGCSCADGVPDEPKGRRETGGKEAMKHTARIAICIAILLVVAALPGCSRQSTTSSQPKPP